MASVPGGIYAGVAQANALKAKARADQQIFEMNKRVGEFKEKDALERGKEEEQKFRKQVKGMIGAQRAAFGGSNIEIGSGSALDVEQDTAAIGEAESLQIRQNARMEAFGYKLEGLGLHAGNMVNQTALANERRTTKATTLINAGSGIAAFAAGGM